MGIRCSVGAFALAVHFNYRCRHARKIAKQIAVHDVHTKRWQGILMNPWFPSLFICKQTSSGLVCAFAISIKRHWRKQILSVIVIQSLKVAQSESCTLRASMEARNFHCIHWLLSKFELFRNFWENNQVFETPQAWVSADVIQKSNQDCHHSI